MNENNALTTFRIDIPQTDIDDLRNRLAHTRWPIPVPGRDDCTDFSRGIPLVYLKELAEYWRHGFDWRAQEEKLNEHEQFTTVVNGQTFHVVHARSANPEATPLILNHGWPGSFVEYQRLIPLLTDEFHVVIPSLPGFGFSGPTADAGWDTDRIARAWAELMRRLGYERYGAQGGDIGAKVSPQLGRVAADRVVGVHVNGGPGPLPPLPVSDQDLATLTDLERDRLARIEAFMRQEFGYIAIQSTRPQTLGYGLTDSPVGQLAWLLDKFREWTHPRETLPEKIISPDWLLTNAMIYWLTGTAGTAAYVGYAQGPAWGAAKANSGVPTAAIVFAHDVDIRRYAETENTITRWTDVDRGGHFAALEEPETLTADIRAFFRDLR
jgi:epoxide hydrolase